MANSKLPKEIHKILVFVNHCPFCQSNDVQDKRYKRYITGLSCHIRRWSRMGFTLECRQCSLRFSMSWQALRNAIAWRAKQESDEQLKRLGKHWAEWLNLWIRDYGIDKRKKRK